MAASTIRTATDRRPGAAAAPPRRIEAARERTASAYEAARSRASDVTRQASDQLAVYPVGAVVGGFAVGALLAAVLPRTRARGPDCSATTGRRLTGAARDAAQNGLRRRQGADRASIARARPRRRSAKRSARRGRRQGLSRRPCARAAILPRRPAMSKLHFVFGGRVKDPRGLDFDLDDDRDGRPLSRLCQRARRLARQGPAHRRRCRDEICRRPPPPPARAGAWSRQA